MYFALLPIVWVWDRLSRYSCRKRPATQTYFRLIQVREERIECSDLVLAVAEVPNDLTRERVAVSQLAANWRNPAAPPELARIGDAFVRRGENCLLLVPSVLAPNENNWLINPAHPEFSRIVAGLRESQE